MSWLFFLLYGALADRYSRVQHKPPAQVDSRRQLVDTTGAASTTRISLDRQKECSMKLKRVEHVAIAVHDIQESKKMLEEIFALRLELEEQIGSTKLAMYPVGETYLELLQTEDTGSKLGDWIAAKGQSLYHLCFEVEDIDSALDELRQKGVKLLNETPRLGHGGSRIAFLDPQSTGNVLIELAELPASHTAH
jgi:methylmalonyl-CoA epimerase